MQAKTYFKSHKEGKGILMWLLSQGRRIEVICPEALREDVKRELEGIMEFYR